MQNSQPFPRRKLLEKRNQRERYSKKYPIRIEDLRRRIRREKSSTRR
jgi:hypothetical protein